MSGASGLTIETGWRGPTHAALTLRGEVDLGTRAEFEAALGRAIDAGATEVDVELRDVPFLDSSGLAALVEATKRGAAVTVRHPQRTVRRVFRVVVVEGLHVAD